MRRVLFPFSSLFKRRNLKQRWWHRLFVVVFFVGFLFFAVAYVAFISEIPNPPINRALILRSFPELESGDEADFDYVKPVAIDLSNAPTLPPGYTIDPPKPPDVFARIDMERNGQRVLVERAGVVAFPQNMPKDQINLFCAKLTNVVTQADRIRFVEAVGWVCAVLVFVFYLAQLAYRVFLYVVLSPEPK